VLGVGKPAALAVVMSPAAVWLVVWRDEVFRTRWLMLVGFCAGSAVSLGVDRFLHPTGATALLVEDGAKFLGVVAWAIYFAVTTIDITRSTINAAMANTHPAERSSVSAEQRERPRPDTGRAAP
jgi:hypothetical protein